MSAARTPAQTSGGALVLFTRDLRVHDQQALATAARENERVLALFVLDREMLRGSAGAPNRLAFLRDCLADLDDSLRRRGGHLIVRSGEPVGEAMALVQQYRLTAIHMSEDVTPYARARARRLREACAEQRVQLRCHPGVTVVAAGELTPAGGDHYRVFTPYWRAWSAVPRGPLVRAPSKLEAPHGAGAEPALELPSLTQLGAAAALQPGGESAARRQLERWSAAGAANYDERRDDLTTEGTSRLSAYLHFGCISARAALERASAPGAGEGFVRQLCWRDFHHQVLAARPDLPHSDYRPRGGEWHRDTRSAGAWRDGRTGYPIVDAGMRQLAAEGFMHNRARLIVGSFLTKTLYLDWRIGAAHFASLLLDADVANNVGNWQWVAGTGNDTRPNRILNPIRQAHRFDPDGEYVRRYIPELAGVSGRAVHEPWRLGSARRALHYPDPLVDHEAAAAEFRSRH